MADKHSSTMRFNKYGRVCQLCVESHKDLAHVVDLNESHWMANSAPVDAFACDPVFLGHLDSDSNGRIRCDEVRRASAWLLDTFSDGRGVDAAEETLHLDRLNPDGRDARKIRAASARILANLGRPNDGALTLDEVRDTKRIFSAADANGDGIIPPSAAQDAAAAKFISDVIATVGGQTDAGGGIGVTAEGVDRFDREVNAYLSWHDRLENADESERAKLMPVGARTPAAYAAWSAVQAKMDEYFRLCATVAFDTESASAFRLYLKPEEVGTDLFAQKLEKAPVAPPDAEGVLDLHGPVNPAWRAPLAALVDETLAPLLGRTPETLSRAEWRTVCETLSSHAAWQAAQPETQVSILGLERLREYRDPRYRDAVRLLIDADRAVAGEIQGVALVEKAILYQRWLIEFVNNFVNFSRLYEPEERALFEMGTLIMDARQFAFCTKIDNRAAHVKVAKNSSAFVLYIRLTHGPVSSEHELAVAVTSGAKGNLYLGKHGIFIDRENRLWDATVVHMIENPISLYQAIKAPFRRVAELLQAQIEKFAGSGQASLEDKFSQGASAVSKSVQQTAQPQPVPARAASGGIRDIMIGGSVAFAALGSSVMYIAKSVKDISWQTAVAVVSFLLLVVIVPVVVSAWVKLRRRDLGTLLEASGWAINRQMRLTRAMKGIFTRRPRLPQEARMQRLDRLKLYANVARKPYKWAGERIRKVVGDIWEAM